MQPFCFQSIPLFSYAVSSSTLNMTDCNTVNNSVAKSLREMESHLLSPSCNFRRLERKKTEPKEKTTNPKQVMKLSLLSIPKVQGHN